MSIRHLEILSSRTAAVVSSYSKHCSNDTYCDRDVNKGGILALPIGLSAIAEVSEVLAPTHAFQDLQLRFITRLKATPQSWRPN